MQKEHQYSHLVANMKRAIAASTVPEPIQCGMDLASGSGSYTAIAYLSKPLSVAQMDSLASIDGLIKKLVDLIEMANLEIATKNLPLSGISCGFLAKTTEEIHRLDFANLAAIHRAKRAVNRNQQAA